MDKYSAASHTVVFCLIVYSARAQSYITNIGNEVWVGLGINVYVISSFEPKELSDEFSQDNSHYSYTEHVQVSFSFQPLTLYSSFMRREDASISTR